MILGISLKHFAKLLQQGDQIKESKRTNRLLTKTSNKVFKTRDLGTLSFSDFVDMERYFEELNYYKFCSIFVKKNFWQTVYVHNLPLIMQDYSNKKKELFEQYHWIFDPPQYGEPAKETVGSEVRKDFVEEFGSYVVLMDVVCKGRISDYKTVEKWTIEQFLFWANYLSGQKITENIK